MYTYCSLSLFDINFKSVITIFKMELLLTDIQVKLNLIFKFKLSSHHFMTEIESNASPLKPKCLISIKSSHRTCNSRYSNINEKTNTFYLLSII